MKKEYRVTNLYRILEIGKGPEREPHPSEYGRFMLYNGILRPSDAYFAAHSLPGYTEDDWWNDAYDVNDDEEILHMKRVCNHCGKEFTLLETAKEYDSLMGWPYYTQQFIGDLCSGCAIKETRSRFPEYNAEKAGD